MWVNWIHRLVSISFWVLHKSFEKNCMDWFSIYHMLFKRSGITSFLRQIVTGDEQWIVDENVVNYLIFLWLFERPVLVKSSICFVFVDITECECHELLSRNQTINSDISSVDRLLIWTRIWKIKTNRWKGNTAWLPHDSVASHRKLHELDILYLVNYIHQILTSQICSIP